MTTATTDKLILYTNRSCPWAHRAHIALAELGLPFEEVTIDLDVPRTAEYLAINPRGLVPSLSVNGQVIIESGIVAAYLADQYPSHLVPASNEPGGAIRRARIALFVDAFLSKFQANLFKLLSAPAESDQKAALDAALEGLEKEVEPLLKDAKPYFGGSDKLTLAEVLTGSFVIRFLSLANEAKLYPAGLLADVAARAPAFSAWATVVANHPSVKDIYDENSILTRTHARIAKFREAKA